MIRKRHIYAFAVLVLLIAGYLLDVQMTYTRIFQEVNASSLTPGINKSEVTELSITTPAQTVTVARQQDKWVIMAPIRGLADPEIIEQILTNVTGARKRNEISAKNLAEYGLAKPETVLNLKTETGKTFTLELGHASTYTGQVFAKTGEDEPVVTVGEHVRNCLLRSPNDFRLARMFDIDTDAMDDYNNIQILRDGSHIQIDRQPNGSWEITKPTQWNAENSVVTDWIRHCGQLRATSFIGESTQRPVTLAEARNALQNTALFVDISRKNGLKATLSVANAGTSTTPVYVAQRSISNEIVTLTNSTIEAIDENESYFRSRQIFTLKPEDVKTFVIEIKMDMTELVRDETGKWVLAEDKSVNVDQKRVNSALENLLQSRIKNYVDLNPPDLTPYELEPVPRFRYTVVSTDNKHEILECGRSETGNPAMVYAHRDGSAPVFTIDFGRDLVITEDQIVDKRFMRPNPDELAEIRIDVNAEMQYVFTRDINKGLWTMLKPLQQVPQTADKARLSRMIEVFSNAVYERDYKAETDKQLISPDLSETSLKVSYFGLPAQDGTRPELLTLRFGKKQPKTTLVESAKDKRIFEITAQQMSIIDSTVKLAIQQ